MKTLHPITIAVRVLSVPLIAALPCAAFELSNNQPFIAAMVGAGFVMVSMCVFGLCAVRVGDKG